MKEKEKATVIDGRYASIQINHIRAILDILEDSMVPKKGVIDRNYTSSIEWIENTLGALNEEVSNLKYRYKFTIEETDQ